MILCDHRYMAHSTRLLILQRHLIRNLYLILWGAICETGDFIGKDRVISIEPNNILVIMDTGAYAMSMSSNYNTRPRLYELMIDKAKTHIIREKETFDHLIKGEKVLPES